MPVRAQVLDATRRPVFETLEARVLYSADFSPLEPVAVAPAADVRTLDGAGDFTSNLDPVAQARRYEIAFVDAGVPASLLETLRQEGVPGRTLEIVQLSAQRDGIAQISELLATRHEVGAVHILSHGADGVVQLGTSRLDFDSLLKNASSIQGWRTALTADADLLIYGCDVASNSAGASLMQALARLTGADVAASNDRTASTAQGGDWDLEFQIGSIEAQLAIEPAAAASWTGTLSISPTVTAPALQSTLEDVPVAVAGVSVSDPEGDLASVALSAGSGTLRMDLSGGASISAGANQSAGLTLAGSQAQINAALATLAYQGAADFNGSDALTIVATDAGGLSQTATVAITVSAVNDAPSVTAPATRTTPVNQQVVFRPGQVSIADVDAGTAIVQVTLTAVNGSASLGGTRGLTFSVGDGSDDPTMVFTGTLDDINGTLKNLRFLPALDFSGTAQLTLLVNDNGSSGAGGAQTGTATALITVGTTGTTPPDVAPPSPVPAPIPTPDPVPAPIPTPAPGPTPATGPASGSSPSEASLPSTAQALFSGSADLGVSPGAGSGSPNAASRLSAQGDTAERAANDVAARIALAAGLPSQPQPSAASEGDGTVITITLRGAPVRVGVHWIESLLTPAGATPRHNRAEAQEDTPPPDLQLAVPAPPTLAPVPGLRSGGLGRAEHRGPQDTDDDIDRLEQALTYVIGAALSAGAVLWAQRTLGLLMPVMVSTPAWQGIDPLPAVAPEDVPDEAPVDDQDVLERAAESMVFRSARSTAAQT